MRIRRRARLDHFLSEQKVTRNTNGSKKRGERARRAARVCAKIKAAPSGPWTREVQSWIADQLGKPASKASQEEIQALIA